MWMICLVLLISDIGLKGYKARGVWHISKGEARLYHYHYTFDIY